MSALKLLANITRSRGLRAKSMSPLDDWRTLPLIFASPSFPSGHQIISVAIPDLDQGMKRARGAAAAVIYSGASVPAGMEPSGIDVH
jgi:hypothetical protein